MTECLRGKMFIIKTSVKIFNFVFQKHFKLCFVLTMLLGSKTELVPKRRTENKLLIIDTDAGSDDAWALFMAMEAHRNSANPNIFKVVGITTVCGNTTVDNVTNNVTRVLDLVNDTAVPIYRGMSDPMINQFTLIETPPYHGEDGFGDADLPDIPTRIEPEHSVNAIIKLVESYPGELTIVCLGPLTNLAMAVKIKPDIKTIIKEIYILGGNIEGLGNVEGASSSSEFNFFLDPEAAQVVLENYSPCPITILSFETWIKYASSSINWRINILGKFKTPQMELLNKIEADYLERSSIWHSPDAVLMACIINPQVILQKQNEYYCSVELKGSLTRGMMVVDRKNVLQKPANATLILKVDRSRYRKLLINTARADFNKSVAQS